MKTEGVENGINRWALITCLVRKCPFPALKGHHHERSKKRFPAYTVYGIPLQRIATHSVTLVFLVLSFTRLE
jgi:hypothetical protein